MNTVSLDGAFGARRSTRTAPLTCGTGTGRLLGAHQAPPRPSTPPPGPGTDRLGGSARACPLPAILSHPSIELLRRGWYSSITHHPDVHESHRLLSLPAVLKRIHLARQRLSFASQSSVHLGFPTTLAWSQGSLGCTRHPNARSLQKCRGTGPKQLCQRRFTVHQAENAWTALLCHSVPAATSCGTRGAAFPSQFVAIRCPLTRQARTATKHSAILVGTRHARSASSQSLSLFLRLSP